MKISLVAYRDTSTVMYNLWRAFQRFTSHEVYFMNTSRVPKWNVYRTPLGKPINEDIIKSSDFVITKHIGILKNKFLLQHTDLFILGRRDHTHSEQFNQIKQCDFGHLMTTQPDFAFKSGITWMPSPTRLYDMVEKYGSVEKLYPPQILCQPTNFDLPVHAIRDFDFIISRLSNLEGRFQTALFHHETQEMAIARKARASIFFDRIWSAYGMNSKEAGALGCAVVTGVSDVFLRGLESEGFPCGFVNVDNKREATTEIRKMIVDEDYRVEVANNSFRHVKEAYNGEISVKRVLEVCD